MGKKRLSRRNRLRCAHTCATIPLLFRRLRAMTHPKSTKAASRHEKHPPSSSPPPLPLPATQTSPFSSTSPVVRCANPPSPSPPPPWIGYRPLSNPPQLPSGRKPPPAASPGTLPAGSVASTRRPTPSRRESAAKADCFSAVPRTRDRTGHDRPNSSFPGTTASRLLSPCICCHYRAIRPRQGISCCSASAPPSLEERRPCPRHPGQGCKRGCVRGHFLCCPRRRGNTRNPCLRYTGANERP